MTLLVAGTNITFRFDLPNTLFISSLCSYKAVPSPAPTASFPYIKLVIPCAIYEGISITSANIKNPFEILFTNFEVLSNSGKNSLCLVFSIIGIQLSIREGIKNTIANMEHTIPFANTIPRSNPIENFIITNTMNPTNVVRELAEIVFIDVLSAFFRAIVLSASFFCSTLYAFSRNIE